MPILGKCGCCSGAGHPSDLQTVIATVPWAGWLPIMPDESDASNCQPWHTSSSVPWRYVTKKYLKVTYHCEHGYLTDTGTVNQAEYTNTLEREQHPVLGNMTSVFSSTFNYISGPAITENYWTSFFNDGTWLGAWPGQNPTTSHPSDGTVLHYGDIFFPTGWFDYGQTPTINQLSETEWEIVPDFIPSAPSGGSQFYFKKISIRLEKVNEYSTVQARATAGLDEVALLDPTATYNWTDIYGTPTTYKFGYATQMSPPFSVDGNFAGLYPVGEYPPGESESTAAPTGWHWNGQVAHSTDLSGVAAYPVAANGAYMSWGYSGVSAGPWPPIRPTPEIPNLPDPPTPAVPVPTDQTSVWSAKSAASMANDSHTKVGYWNFMAYDHPTLAYVVGSDWWDGRGPGELLFDPGDCAAEQYLHINIVPEDATPSAATVNSNQPINTPGAVNEL